MAVAKNLDVVVRTKLDQLKALGKQGVKSLKPLGDIAKSVSASFKELSKSAGSVFAGTLGAHAAIGGIQSVVSAFKALTIEQHQALLGQESLATILGTNSNTLRQFYLAADRATLGIGEMDAALLKTAQNVQDGEEWISELGLSFEELKALDVPAQFLEILKAIEKLPTANERVKKSVQAWGRSGAQILQATSQGFEDAAQDAVKFGLTMTDENKKSVDALWVSWTDLWARVKGISIQTLVGVSDSLAATFEGLGQGLDLAGIQNIANVILEKVQVVRDAAVRFTEDVINGMGGMSKTALQFEKSLLEIYSTMNILTSSDFWKLVFNPFAPEAGHDPDLVRAQTRMTEINAALANTRSTTWSAPEALKSPMKVEIVNPQTHTPMIQQQTQPTISVQDARANADVLNELKRIRQAIDKGSNISVGRI